MPTRANINQHSTKTLVAEKARAELRHDGLLVFHEAETHTPRRAVARARARRSRVKHPTNKAKHAIKRARSVTANGAIKPELPLAPEFNMGVHISSMVPGGPEA